MEVVTSKKCSLCLEVLPMRDYRFVTSRMLYAARCRGCEKDESRDRARKAGAKPGNAWTDAELEVLHKNYSRLGSAATAALIPTRTQTQVYCRAKYDGLRYDGPTLGGSPSKDDEPWGVPAHDYTPPDFAVREWRTSTPGTFAPNMGTVMGIAA